METCVLYTRFHDLDESGAEQHISYGYRIFHEQDADYFNMFASFEELRAAVNIETLGDWVAEHHPEFIESILSTGGIILNGEWIEVQHATGTNI